MTKIAVLDKKSAVERINHTKLERGHMGNVIHITKCMFLNLGRATLSAAMEGAFSHA